MDFNEKLQLLRKSRGISQEKLAEEIGVSRQLITQWEEGDEIPDMHSLMALSEWFNVSLDELLRDRINPSTLQKLGFLDDEHEDGDDLLQNVTLSLFMIAMIISLIMDKLIIGLICGGIGLCSYYLIRKHKIQ